MKWKIWWMTLFLAACGEPAGTHDELDPIDDCFTCDDKADAFGISRTSYLAYGIVRLANTASFDELDVAVGLDARAASGIVSRRPFEFIEEVDAVPYVGRAAFAALASYAQTQGLPYCGDGHIEATLEACDDGNVVNGDGCSATCVLDVAAAPDLGLEPNLIKGSDIGVPQVNPAAYYFRKRTVVSTFSNSEMSFQGSPEMRAFFRRVETLRAGTVDDGIVTWDDLALMSKSPFYDALLPNERLLLQEAWDMFALNTDPVVNVENPTPVVLGIPHAIKITKTGRFRVPNQTVNSAVAQRLQQLPGLNADNDPTTVEFRDVTYALEHYDNVFTSGELSTLEDLRDRMFEDAQPKSSGRVDLEFGQFPDATPHRHTVAEFDGWKFEYSTANEVAYHTANTPFRPSLSYSFTKKSDLSLNGQFDNDCDGQPDFSYCTRAFRYRGVRYYKPDGTVTYPRFDSGLLIMEYWEDGKRTYNRVLNMKSANLHASPYPKLSASYFAARPRFQGAALGFAQVEEGKYQLTRGGNGAYPVPTLIPEYLPTLRQWLPIGRYSEEAGVVIDAHASGAVVAYFDGCTVLGKLATNSVEFACATSGRKVVISKNGLTVTDNGQTTYPLRRDMTYL
ncbi:MAG: myxococcus cysteine-rich repeat containing protein [bacterium]